MCYQSALPFCFSLQIQILLYSYIYLCVCEGMYMAMVPCGGQGMFGSRFFPFTISHGSWVLNSGHQAWWQAPLCAEPSYQPCFALKKAQLYIFMEYRMAFQYMYRMCNDQINVTDVSITQIDALLLLLLFWEQLIISINWLSWTIVTISQNIRRSSFSPTVPLCLVASTLSILKLAWML